MMPPGLLDPLADNEVIDLVGYLKTAGAGEVRARGLSEPSRSSRYTRR
jgi:hypothetical protein